MYATLNAWTFGECVVCVCVCARKFIFDFNSIAFHSIFIRQFVESHCGQMRIDWIGRSDLFSFDGTSISMCIATETDSKSHSVYLIFARYILIDSQLYRNHDQINIFPHTLFCCFSEVPQSNLTIRCPDTDTLPKALKIRRKSRG